ncbi:MAG: ATP-binding cassette domain-containing protein, partial [Pseudomonadota bacterium]
LLQLEPYLDRRPSDLSGGQRQRVAMGRAIVRRPSVFLFDEPLSNLDAKLRTQMRAEIKRLHNRLGVTSVYVTHDQVEAMTLASRIVVLANKGIAQVGSPLELYETPENEFVAQFIGSPQMNLLPGEVVETGKVTKVKVHAGGGVIEAGIPTLEADKGMRVNVGIRPEDMMQTDGEDFAYTGVVEITEALGEVTLLYFGKDPDASSSVIAKLPGIHRDLRGTSPKLTAAKEKVHLFANGQSLLYR